MGRNVEEVIPGGNHIDIGPHPLAAAAAVVLIVLVALGIVALALALFAFFLPQLSSAVLTEVLAYVDASVELWPSMNT